MPYLSEQFKQDHIHKGYTTHPNDQVVRSDLHGWLAKFTFLYLKCLEFHH